MSKTLTSKPDAKSTKAGKTASPTTIARLFFLDLASGRVMSCNPDGSDLKTISEAGKLPDGIVVDLEAGHLYWTNMGSSVSANDGSIYRADLDGKSLTTIVPEGRTHTPKQLQIDKKNRKLYW
jgi:DNA-binding beta-propeller fold protein YncE